MKKYPFLFAFLLHVSTTVVASEEQTWFQFLSQGKVSTSLRTWVEIQPRYSFNIGNLSTILIRPGVGYELFKDFVLWGGYGWTPLIRPIYRDEHRLWFQGAYVLKVGSFAISQRLRLEHRSIESIANPAWRLRYLLRGTVPLVEEATWSAVTYNEVFFALNDALPTVLSGFDQNRLFVGVNHRFNSSLALDAGYMWNTIKQGANANRNLHLLMVTLFHSFDCTKEGSLGSS